MGMTRIEQEFADRVPNELRRLRENIERLTAVLMLANGVTESQLKEFMASK